MNEELRECGIARTLGVIGGKWTVLIVRDLLTGPRRFSELEHSLNGISPRTLAIRLKELEHDGILDRQCDPCGLHPVYSLTDKGKSLQQILELMRHWGENSTEAIAARS